MARSTLGPLPVVDELPDIARVIDRFQSVPDSYRRKRYNIQSVKKGISYYKSLCRRNPSLAAFQAFSLYLFDLNEYATIENDSQLRELVIQGGQILYRCLYGDLWPGGSTEWETFNVRVQGDLSMQDRRIIDIVEHQPTSNRQLADRWEFDDRKAVWNYLQTEFSQFVTRNSDQFACATESARRYVQGPENNSKIELIKEPPRVPSRGNIALEVSEDQSKISGSEVNWNQ